jgi:hypothetical protein
VRAELGRGVGEAVGSWAGVGQIKKEIGKEGRGRAGRVGWAGEAGRRLAGCRSRELGRAAAGRPDHPFFSFFLFLVSFIK